MSLKQNFVKGAVGLFGKTAQVKEVEVLSKHIVRVRFQGKAIKEMDWSPGDKIKLNVGGGMRSYTPYHVNQADGQMDAIFHLHEGGLASDWVRQLQTSTEVSFFGPASSVRAVTEATPWALFFGDETTLGLAQALYDALPQNTPFQGFIELAQDDVGAVDAFDAPLYPVARKEQYGDALLHALQALTLADTPGTIWLSGEANSVLSLRRALLAQGIPRQQLIIKPYWSTKGKAHRKQLERTELRD